MTSSIGAAGCSGAKKSEEAEEGGLVWVLEMDVVCGDEIALLLYLLKEEPWFLEDEEEEEDGLDGLLEDEVDVAWDEEDEDAALLEDEVDSAGDEEDEDDKTGFLEDEDRVDVDVVGDGDEDEAGEDAMLLEDELDAAGADEDAAGADDAGADSDVLLWLPDDWLLLFIDVATIPLFVGLSLTV